MSSAVTSERFSDVVVWTINRPKALNAINSAVLEGLAEQINAVKADASVKVVILRGSGEKAFVAGADIKEMQGYSAIEAEFFAGQGQAIFNQIAALRVPVIAAVHGFALGGGCELAMACDLIFAGPKAKFGQPEVKLGVIPGFGGTQRLVRRVGWSNALDLCLTARMIGADEAKQMGLVSRVFEDDLFDQTMKIASKMSRLGGLAVGFAKRAIHENADSDLLGAQAAERSLFGLCFSTEDQKEGMAAFVEQRHASFKGR